MKIISITFQPSLIDSYSLVITITGYCIVLLALSLMAYFFTRLHTLQDYLARRRQKKEGLNQQQPIAPVITGEENAAISTALFLFFSEMHDEEKYVMTIRKVSKIYSPWSSKFYGIWNSMKHW